MFRIIIISFSSIEAHISFAEMHMAACLLLIIPREKKEPCYKDNTENSRFLLRFFFHCTNCSLKSCIKLTRKNIILTMKRTYKNEASTMHSFVMEIFIFFVVHLSVGPNFSPFLSPSLLMFLPWLCKYVYLFSCNIFISSLEVCSVLCSKWDCLLSWRVFCSTRLSKSFKQICRLSLS